MFFQEAVFSHHFHLAAFRRPHRRYLWPLCGRCRLWPCRLCEESALAALVPWDPETLSCDTKPRSWALNSLKVNVFQQQKCNFSKYILLATPCFHTSTSTQQFFPRYREAELAHGRVCMLATLGFSVQTSGAKFEPFITRTSDVLKISMFSLPGLLLFFDFLIFGSTCKWFTIFLWCYWFKTLQKSTTKCFFHGFSFHHIFTTWGSFFTRLSYRLRRSFEGCDPGMLEEQHWIQFVTNQQTSWFFWWRIFWFKDFQFFSFWVAQNFETESSESRCFWWLIFFFRFCMLLWWDGKGEGSNEQCEEQCFQAFVAACHWVV